MSRNPNADISSRPAALAGEGSGDSGQPQNDANRAGGGTSSEGIMGLAGRRAKQRTDARQLWRSLEELAQTDRYRDFLHDEFPPSSAQQVSQVKRRDMLKLMSASAALAGLTACTKLPPEKIVPYVTPPEEFVPGIPLFYATAMPFGEAAIGVLAESHMGRPTKIEGNPDHPGSLGVTDVFAQASILTLYDPERSQTVVKEGRIGSWGDFLNDIGNAVDQQHLTKGAGLRILTETVISPTLASQLRALLTQFPAAKWHQYEPAGRDWARAGAKLAFGEYVNTMYRFDRADVVVSLDADFLCSGPRGVRYTRDFTDKRRVSGPNSTMNRLYAVESTMTNTGAMADHRLSLRSADVEAFARVLAAGLGVKLATPSSAGLSRVPPEWIPAMVRDLQGHRGSSIIIAGDQQPPAVHALAHAMNQLLGNAGKTVVYTDPVEANPVDGMQSLRELATDMHAGRVDTLVIIGANPVFTAPADLAFTDNLLKVKTRIHLGLYNDETAELCHWHIPEAHYLESWGDARAYDGTVSIIQPLIAPLYGGKSAHELLSALLGQPGRPGRDSVYEYWKGQGLAKDDKAFDVLWQTSLEKGLIAGTALPAKQVSLKVDSNPAGGAIPGARAADAITAEELELVFRPDPTIWDGRFANNGWLQELPKPFTKLTWDNAALVSVDTARKLNVGTDDLILLRHQGRELRVAVLVLPGQADDSVTLHLGYGRKRAGRVGTDLGFSGYALRTSAEPWFASGLEVQKTGEHYHLVETQKHHLISGEGSRPEEEESVEARRRSIVRAATLEEFHRNPEFAKDPEELTDKRLTLYKNYPYQGYAWGMSIDLSSCVGCNACVIACQAENNIAVVGKQQVDNGREMHWIRVDTYYEGGLANPKVYNEVVPCMHCENAPCELVCPVAATMHGPEGLNEMIYNRCVGTRYCSNNCPYKVRRFNFLLFSDWTTPSLYGLRNPNVTVRSRGVMEKCTYCIQRINAVKIEAEKQDREVRDGEILTACQQSCPAQAIVFGNINDPNSRVAKLKAQSRNFGLLADLNTRPRTTYLAKLSNPNPEIKG